jgi:predicted enzyme involved in methoxymalonyl-ACP biosynthesis
VALVRIAGNAWRVDSFLMSCRVIGYGIETALLGLIARDAAAAGCDRLDGEFAPTPKNAPAQDLYQKHGFSLAAEAEGVQRWELDLHTGGVPLPAWVSITEEDK